MSAGLHAVQRVRWAALIALVLCVYGMEAHARRTSVPAPAQQGDQGAYLRYARQMHESGYQVVGGRNRMPVFPFLLSLLYEPGMAEEEFLARGQAFNVYLSAVILAALCFVYWRHFPPYWSAALIAAAAFGVFLYRSVFVQAEPLFYFFSFCMFLSFWRMLIAPTLWLAVWSGGISAVAHLTKASVLPAIALFAVVFTAKIVWDYRAPRNASDGPRWRAPALLAVVIGTFLLCVFPYIQTSKRVFGRYFYNVNSTFYMWCDSFEEVKRLTRAHGDRSGWPTMPPEQIPSAGKYWREHSVAQIGGRLGTGLTQILTNNAGLHGYYKYLLTLGGIAAVLALRRRRELLQAIEARLFATLFVALFFGGYLLLYAWYEPLSGHSRFLLTLFLPFTFAASKLIARLGGDVTFQIAGRGIGLLPLTAAVLLAFAVGDALHAAVRPAHPTLSSLPLDQCTAGKEA